MRILYIANNRIPTEKAHGRQIVKTIEALALAGQEVKLLLPGRRNIIEKSLFDFYGARPVFKVVYAFNFLSWLEKVWPKSYFILQRFFFGIYSFVYGLLTGADCIYSREITVCFFLSFFKKNVVFEDHEPKKSFLWLYRIFIKIIRKKVIVAKNLSELYKSFGAKEKTFVAVPNGADLNDFKSAIVDKNIWQKEFGLDRSDKVVLYTGHFYGWKGVYTLIESALYLNPKIKIVMIGGLPQDQAKMKKFILDFKLKNVYLHDFIEHSQLIKFIKSADILVLPNTAEEERSAKYTTPIKLFESLASGVPLIASDLESFKDYLVNNENAILFQADNPKNLAEKINYLAGNREVAQKIACKALAEALKYSWEERAKKIINFI